MATATDSPHDLLQASNSEQSGHWFPALRPDALDENEATRLDGVRELPIINGNVPTHAPALDAKHTLVEAPEQSPAGPSPMRKSYNFTQEEDKNTTSETTLPWTSQPANVAGVGDELPSDDDDERLDPAWGIKRMDSTQILQTVNRSTTFPDFELPQKDTAEESTPEPASKPENESSTNPLSLEQETPTMVSQEGAWLYDREDVSQESFPWTISERPESVDEAAQRFDEGLPLIQTEIADKSHAKEQNEVSSNNPFNTVQDEGETNFFANLDSSSAKPPEPQHLRRKSTAQVIDALQFSRPDRLESPVVGEHNESSFFDNLDHEPGTNNGKPQIPVQEDMDAMWKAALDDNEFLVEDADDLLPDSGPSSPSSFVASLQRGNLAMVPEDNLGISNVQANSPIPTQQTPPRRQNSANPYAPHQPSVSDMLQLSPPSGIGTTTSNIGLSRPALPQHTSFQGQVQQRPSAPQHMQSFADQAKDGYKSPYDLPMEISKPRKRVAPHPVQTTKTIPPPPRSSSLSEKPLQSPFNPSGAAIPPTNTLPRSTNAAVMPPRSVSAFTQPPRTETHKSSSSTSFFEELPPVSRPRPTSNHGRYTPQQIVASPPQQLLPQSPPSRGMRQDTPSPPRVSESYAQYELRPPERLDPYANVALHPPVPALSVSNTRYSPAPVTTASGPRPGPSPRYSPAPPPQTALADQGNRYASQPASSTQSHAAPPVLNRYASQPPPSALPPSNILAFQPRTSSPLAFHKTSVEEDAATITPLAAQVPRAGPIPRQASHSTNFSIQASITPETTNFPTATPLTSPPKRPGTENLPPPRRSQTQSPSKQRPQPSFHNLVSDFPNRPASAYGQASPSKPFAETDHGPMARPHVRFRGLAPELEFVRPVDDTQFDPLERWKGAPLISFGFGGSLVCSFPKHVPRYTTGATRPQIKTSSGEISIRNVRDILPQSDLLNTFPGPLRNKAKKKDILSWMTTYISALESSPLEDTPLHSLINSRGRRYEKILLWKIVRALVEHDGSLEGTALNAVNIILSPEVHALDETTATQYRMDEQLTGIYRPSGANVRMDSVDPLAVENLRKRLLSGDRQAAVIHAMDNRLWSHALIISSTMERSMWSQVVREFVRQEVKTVGNNSEPLSALYEIFGGNLEESIDELVPPSARAGLRMVSKVDNAGPAKNALDGLNRWKETLSLILNNRSPGDRQALAVLGKLLEDYQRIDAAHICYLFSRTATKAVIMGGIDEDQTPIVLLGADHRAHPFEFARDQEAILLSEIYEFASSVLAGGSLPTTMPHLSVYKLQRASVLAENGMKSEAQAYCEAISATVKSSTKLSPYYHPLFLGELDDLSARLKQTPMQGSSSWIVKPSLEKVSGSVWNKFTNFVAGDDSDADSKGSGKDTAEAGPFANIAGTPSLSRSGSQSDIYGSYPLSSPPLVPNTAAASRYAPNGVHSARSSSELTRGRPSLDAQRSPPSTSHAQTHRQYEPVNMLQQSLSAQPQNPYQSVVPASPPVSYPQSPPGSSYMPNNVTRSVIEPPPAHHQAYTLTNPVEDVVTKPYGYTPETQPHLQQHEEVATYGGYQAPEHPEEPTLPPQDEGISGGYEPPAQSYGYDPPAENGYVPYVPEPDSPEEPEPKKKSFMDDDDGDEFTRGSDRSPPSDSSQSPEDDAVARKRANDAAADAAFRAAAEADAAREKEKQQSKRSSSWFGGWLGGKKPQDGLDTGVSKGAEPKVYRANLGESKMKLYFDKDLGKWVNPDNPDVGKKTATPPPPRMGSTPAPPSGPPRTLAAGHITSSSLPNVSMGLPSVPASRTGTPANGLGGGLSPGHAPGGLSGPPSATSTPPLGLAPTSHPGLAPPAGTGSRPGTAMSNASSIDDLIGPAAGRKGAKGAKKAKGRYVDVMAK